MLLLLLGESGCREYIAKYKKDSALTVYVRWVSANAPDHRTGKLTFLTNQIVVPLSNIMLPPEYKVLKIKFAFPPLNYIIKPVYLPSTYAMR